MKKSCLLSATTALFTVLTLTMGPAQGGSNTHPLDVWLADHPAVAAVLIWEFPPKAEIPYIPRRPVQWGVPSIHPDPVDLPLYEQFVLPEIDLPPGIFDSSSTVAYSGPAETTSQDLSQPLDLPIELLAVKRLPRHRLPGGAKKSEYGAEIRAWNKWPEWEKQVLRARYTDYLSWAQTACVLYADYANSGFTIKPDGFDAAFSSINDVDPVPVTDPPINIQPDDPLVPKIPWAMLTSADAFALYARLVAAQLAVETSGCVPWSLEDYDTADLALLFDGRFTFRYVPAGISLWHTTETGYLLDSGVTPAPPLVVLGFLGQNGLIGADREESLIRFLEWEREHLTHVIGGAAPANPLPAGILYWDYNGRPPVSRMINGTHMAEPIYYSWGSSFFDPEPRHWYNGCGGASFFNYHVLRVMNIAAEPTVYHHYQNRFAIDGGVHVGSCHGDDPYALQAAPEIPMAASLLDDATFHAWFVNQTDETQLKKTVGRCKGDLYIEYLPQILLVKHCRDLWQGDDHANSEVYQWVGTKTYTVEELEAIGLWTNLEAEVETLGGCEVFGY